MKRNKTVESARRGVDCHEETTALTGALTEICGSPSLHWNSTLMLQVVQSQPMASEDDPDGARRMGAAIDAMKGIGPRDELEGMITAQLIAAHNAAMECYRRAMRGGASDEARREALNQAARLSRTWAQLLDALNKHRGKGQQKVTVEHVQVHSGGQAMVGVVERPGGGGQENS